MLLKFIVMLVLAFYTSPLWADMVEFKSGKVVEGKITKVTSTGITLESGSDILGISYTQIKDIRQSTAAGKKNSDLINDARAGIGGVPLSTASSTPLGKSKKVEVYMTSWCGYCRKMVSFLNNQGIPFTAYDIEKSPAAHSAFKRYGGSGVPLVVVGDKVIYGYNPQGVVAALQ